MEFTSPSTPRLSKYTDSRVSHWPGRIRTDSLNVSPYRSLRAATTSGFPCGATAGTGIRPYMTQARPTPARASTKATIPAVVRNPCETGGTPTTGARNFCSRSSMIRNAPAPTEPIAMMTIGMVITGGDSCGCASASQRRFPCQVMSIIRVM